MVVELFASLVNQPFITQHFGNPMGLYGLLALIPLLILYLVKPKPKHVQVPSLMFILKDIGSKRTANFLRTFLRDMLLLIQILILLLFTFALAKPQFETYAFEKVDNAIIVIDVSASMEAKTDGKIRFDTAVDLAKKALGSRNTIIMAGDAFGYPKILSQDETADEAKKTLSALKPKDIGSDTGTAINLASQEMEGKEGIIYVFSDFIDTKYDLDLLVKKKAVEAKGQQIRYISLGGKADNVGIVNIKAENTNFTVYLKNYNNDYKDITLKLGNTEKKLRLKPNAQSVELFTTQPGVTKVEITTKDDLQADNVAYFSSPEKVTYEVLLITNNPETSYMEKALLANPMVHLTKGTPPNSIPDIDHDLVIIKDINPAFILPGKMKEIKDRVKNGMGLVIFAQPFDKYNSIFSIDSQGLIPTMNVKDGLVTEAISTKKKPFVENDVEFGQVLKYYILNTTQPVDVIANAEDGTPLIFRFGVGAGKVYYYGLFEKYSSFHTQPTYPIFWALAVDELVNRRDITYLNRATGSNVVFSAPISVQFSDGSKKQVNAVPLEKVGIYKFEDASVVANLFNEKESALEPDTKIFDKLDNSVLLSKTKVKRDVSSWVIYAILVFVLFEMLYVKMRGDF